MKIGICWFMAVAAMCSPAVAGTFDFVIQTTADAQTYSFHTDNAQNFTIDWGDGNVETNLSGTAVRSHVYAVAGTYTNKVSGVARGIAFGSAGTTPMLLRDIVSKMDDGVAGITSAYNMFNGARNITQFTQSDWFDSASSNVTRMSYMFYGAKYFNQDISGWNVAKVTAMDRMFYEASSFNQDISGWDVGNVTTFHGAFFKASSFNQPIGVWDVGSATTIFAMFLGATSFNQDLSLWDVSNVTTMQSAFSGAASFNQDLSLWDVSQVGNFTGFLTNVALSTDNYNSLLMRYSKLAMKAKLTFDGGNSKYDFGLPEEARQKLIDDFAWTIIDGGSSGKWYAYAPTVIKVQ